MRSAALLGNSHLDISQYEGGPNPWRRPRAAAGKGGPSHICRGLCAGSLLLLDRKTEARPDAHSPLGLLRLTSRNTALGRTGRGWSDGSRLRPASLAALSTATGEQVCALALTAAWGRTGGKRFGRTRDAAAVPIRWQHMWLQLGGRPIGMPSSRWPHCCRDLART